MVSSAVPLLLVVRTDVSDMDTVVACMASVLVLAFDIACGERAGM